jgi:hypothetical protein
MFNEAAGSMETKDIICYSRCAILLPITLIGIASNRARFLLAGLNLNFAVLARAKWHPCARLEQSKRSVYQHQPNISKYIF